MWLAPNSPCSSFPFLLPDIRNIRPGTSASPSSHSWKFGAAVSTGASSLSIPSHRLPSWKAQLNAVPMLVFCSNALSVVMETVSKQPGPTSSHTPSRLKPPASVNYFMSPSKRINFLPPSLNSQVKFYRGLGGLRRKPSMIAYYL